jgi:hypothetical protein
MIDKASIRSYVRAANALSCRSHQLRLTAACAEVKEKDLFANPKKTNRVLKIAAHNR